MIEPHQPVFKVRDFGYTNSDITARMLVAGGFVGVPAIPHHKRAVIGKRLPRARSPVEMSALVDE